MTKKFTDVLVSAIGMMGMDKAYIVCLGLFSLGILCAFARFLPPDKVTPEADSALVQIVSAVCLVLSGFVFALVVGSAKERSSRVNSEEGSGVRNVGEHVFEGLKHFPGTRHPCPMRNSGLKSQPVKADRAADLLEEEVGSKGAKDFVSGRARSGTSAQNAVDFEVFDPRKMLIDKAFADDDTRAFLEDRLEGLAIDSPQNEEKVLEWGFGVVSLFDEISLLRTHLTTGDRELVDVVCDSIRNKMTRLNLAVVDEEEWNPSKQRAVSVTRSETAITPRILRKKACGMTYCGKVVKKQEVEIEMPFAG